MPSLLPDGLTLATFPRRATPYDVIVMPAHASNPNAPQTAVLDDHTALPAGARVGTSSLRRACQLRAARPDLQLLDVRGNVDTRLRKLAEGQYEAIVLAAAGLERLGLLQTAVGDQGLPMELNGDHFTVFTLAPGRMLPAVAQGALAIEARSHDTATLHLLAALDDAPTRAAVLAERAFLRRLEGGCQVPIAAHARVNGDSVQLSGMVGSLDGVRTIYGQMTGHRNDPEPIGTALAERLIERGAEQILAELRQQAEAGL
jgi:hydroxymethylbilane synthase